MASHPTTLLHSLSIQVHLRVPSFAIRVLSRVHIGGSGVAQFLFRLLIDRATLQTSLVFIYLLCFIVYFVILIHQGIILGSQTTL